ncbi:37S ribosomal protein S24, mitochondrial [Onygenales sp. PD_12]|nr:37S ribosomal protein S24, mitochondrial [Onygenales sp. PD_12]
MASVSVSFGRAALVLCRQAAPKRKPICPSAFKPTRQFAPFSHASRLRSDDDSNVFHIPDYSPDLLGPSERAEYEALTAEDKKVYDQEFATIAQALRNENHTQTLRQMDKEAQQISSEVHLESEQDLEQWCYDAEPDESIMYKEDGMNQMAYDELHQHQDIRHYARIAAWEMPLLSKLAKPFELPAQTQILRFRYTTYMGETHPAETKVVVEFCSKDLTPKYLAEEQRVTLLKLVGTRYNPELDIIRMSTEKFPTRAQNKRYLGDLVNSLIKEAKEGDSYADVPLDLRHHKSKPKTPFPESWAMTEERRKQLDEAREEKKRLAQEKLLQVTDGNEVIEQAIRTLPELNANRLGSGGEGPRETVAVRAGGQRRGNPQKSRLRR